MSFEFIFLVGVLIELLFIDFPNEELLKFILTILSSSIKDSLGSNEFSIILSDHKEIEDGVNSFLSNINLKEGTLQQGQSSNKSLSDVLNRMNEIKAKDLLYNENKEYIELAKHKRELYTAGASIY